VHNSCAAINPVTSVLINNSIRVVNTQNFRNSTKVIHALKGEINNNGAAVGGHLVNAFDNNTTLLHYFDAMGNPVGSIANAAKNIYGVAKGKISVNGVVKVSNNHTLFPYNWSAQKTIDSINEAFNNKIIKDASKDLYEGTLANGMKIQMYIKNGLIDTAFPIF
jgi:DNA gyrase/topoisomerase IV subunit A